MKLDYLSIMLLQLEEKPEESSAIGYVYAENRGNGWEKPAFTPVLRYPKTEEVNEFAQFATQALGDLEDEKKIRTVTGKNAIPSGNAYFMGAEGKVLRYTLTIWKEDYTWYIRINGFEKEEQNK